MLRRTKGSVADDAILPYVIVSNSDILNSLQTTRIRFIEFDSKLIDSSLNNLSSRVRVLQYLTRTAPELNGIEIESNSS